MVSRALSATGVAMPMAGDVTRAAVAKMEDNVVTDPVVHVTNQANHPVCIARDPNWDDQVLLINGRPATRSLCLAPGTAANVGVRAGADAQPEENWMGIIFAEATNFHYGQVGMYQTTFGQHPDTNLLSVTDEHTSGTPAVRYSVANQTQWSMDMTFVDA